MEQKASFSALFWFFIVFLLNAVVLSGVIGCGKDNDGTEENAADGTNPYPPVPSGGGSVTNAGKNLALLQRRFPSAVINPTPWAGFWWPYTSDGIANAAEKYDSVNSSTSASWERGSRGSGLSNVADWWGHCNGWAAAAILSQEPRAPVTVGGVNFGIADRKALLSETFMEVDGDFLGTRTNSDNTSSNAFRDVNPAQFYLMLTNVMGVQKRSFVLDRYTGLQVWNQPMVAYSTNPVSPADYLGPDPEFPNIHRVNMTTTIWWVDDNVPPNVVTPPFNMAAPANVFSSRTLKYELWLDGAPVFDGGGTLVSSGNIVLTEQGGRSVGGNWKNSSLPAVNSHPDYMWIPTTATPSTGYKNPRIKDSWVLQHMGG